MRIRLAITLDVRRDREANGQGDREVQLDALVESQGRERIGFTIPGPSNVEYGEGE